MTAAIVLRLSGREVEVHERKDHCGKDTDDFQFLENWCFEQDVLDFLERIGIKTDFYIKPWFSQEFMSPGLRKYTGRSSEPLMYLVKRGRVDRSLDRCLAQQALKLGVRVRYRSKLESSEADVIATGFNRPAFLATGITFRSRQPDRSIVLLDNALASRFYSYFIVNDHQAEIACVNPAGFKDHQRRLKKTVERFERVVGRVGDIQKRFSSAVGFGRLGAFGRRDSRPFVGEAAGFQDHLAGFGMVYAFRSGYLAARSIAERKNYEAMCKSDFGRQMRISCWNRSLYDRLSNREYERLVDLLKSRRPLVRWCLGGNDLRLIMRRLYGRPFFLLLGPLLLAQRTKGNSALKKSKRTSNA